MNTNRFFECMKHSVNEENTLYFDKTVSSDEIKEIANLIKMIGVSIFENANCEITWTKLNEEKSKIYSGAIKYK